MDEAKFQKAFNQGYILAEHAPTLMDSLKATTDQSNEYLNGILLGSQQYEIDKTNNISKNQRDQQAIEKNDKSLSVRGKDFEINKD